MIRKIPFSILAVTSLAVCVLPASAQPEQPSGTSGRLPPGESAAAKPAPEPAKDLNKSSEAQKKDEGAVLKPGVIASAGGTAGPSVANLDTGGAAPGDQPAAVAASIRKGKGPGRCEAVVINTSETDSYSVSFAVKMYNKKTLRPTGSSSYSAALGPKKTSVKSFNCAREDGVQVLLKKGVRTGSTKPKQEAQPAGEAEKPPGR